MEKNEFLWRLIKIDLRICVFQILPFLFYPIEDVRAKMIIIFAVLACIFLELISLLISSLIAIYAFSVTNIKMIKTVLVLLYLLYLSYSFSTLHDKSNNTTFVIFYLIISVLLLLYYYNKISEVIASDEDI